MLQVRIENFPVKSYYLFHIQDAQISGNEVENYLNSSQIFASPQSSFIHEYMD